MARRQSDPSLIALFDSLLPDDPRIARRKMFGYPAAFVDGKLFAGLFRDRVVLRLTQRDYDALAAEHDVTTFEPVVGRKMRGLIVLPETLVLDRMQMDDLIGRAMRNAKAIAAGANRSRPSRTSRI
jgi:TfoX/Sxy family transcriptional regulator of competence genes